MEQIEKTAFPKDFLWGSASAAYQIEGAYAEDLSAKPFCGFVLIVNLSLKRIISCTTKRCCKVWASPLRFRTAAL